MEAVDSALDGIRQALEADGYELKVGPLEAGTLRLTVAATENACEECLVPKHLMKAMITQSLSPDLGIRDIDLRYPKD